MASSNPVLIIEISDLFLVATDINRSLGALPPRQKAAVAPLIAQMGEWRLTTIHKGVAHPTELMTRLSQFLELLVEETKT